MKRGLHMNVLCDLRRLVSRAHHKVRRVYNLSILTCKYRIDDDGAKLSFTCSYRISDSFVQVAVYGTSSGLQRVVYGYAS